MKVAVLTIGNELTSGRTLDTNTALIARMCHLRDWPVTAALSVGDDVEKIRQGLAFVMADADAVIITGGLGPTSDDITTAAIAEVFGLPLRTDETVLANLRKIFERRNLVWTENNAKQAVFPEGAEVITNPVGTAAGFAVRQGAKIIAVIPGVPGEVGKMMPEEVIPLLERTFPEAGAAVVVKTIKTFGLSEAAVDEKLADVDFAGRDIAIGFYPNFPENHIVLTTRHECEEEAKNRLAWATAEIVSRLPKHHIFAYDADTLEGIIARLLTEKELTLATAESCTGGPRRRQADRRPRQFGLHGTGRHHIQQPLQDRVARCSRRDDRKLRRRQRTRGASHGRGGSEKRREPIWGSRQRALPDREAGRRKNPSERSISPWQTRHGPYAAIMPSGGTAGETRSFRRRPP